MTLTIKELKEFIKDLPETNINGEPFEVWFQTGKGLSSPVTELSRLNVCKDGYDIYLGNDEVFKEA
jgi:hypothetical protein